MDENMCMTLPVGYVPTPSAPYRAHRKSAQLLQQPGAPRLMDGSISPRLAAAPPAGARVLIWKQDPSVAEIGTRKLFMPGVFLEGPRDARITFGQPGIAPVSPNVFGDFIMQPDTDQFDAVHSFAVVRLTLTMYQRVLARADQGAPLPWAWNNSRNTEPLQVFPHGLPNVMNAYYSRNDRALKFGHFVPSGDMGRVFTCRSFDIVAHETGHAVLDGLKPKWILNSAPPQTGGLHESFGDLTAIFLALSQFDQVEAVVAQTKADLHDKTFLADMAEQFGLALGRPNGLRNADNDLKLSDTGNEVHAISQVFTGAIYDILADIFSFERAPGLRDDAAVLHHAAGYLCSLVLRALVAAPDTNAKYADVVNQMLRIAAEDGKPLEYASFIRNRFTLREVVVASPAPLTADQPADGELGAMVEDAPDAQQDRRTCCGTMNHAEYFDMEGVLEAERQALAAWCKNYGAHPGEQSVRK
ncbi:hypothetical protein GTP41_05000 [Pseudoduganella sp. DS3]|uniref:Peptidase M4 domain-containing protein n=1 Tax=Pseudoduganella guangdongensis TaxID=2692179 RepID=A0A6N9HEH9_9BURK|nr:hypothetical protein [Pseudoduganella guangdongensis]MYN01453.1 hypothetical protein [Pseudoduganella guangdongensis]